MLNLVEGIERSYKPDLKKKTLDFINLGIDFTEKNL